MLCSSKNILHLFFEAGNDESTGTDSISSLDIKQQALESARTYGCNYVVVSTISIKVKKTLIRIKMGRRMNLI